MPLAFLGLGLRDYNRVWATNIPGTHLIHSLKPWKNHIDVACCFGRMVLIPRESRP